MDALLAERYVPLARKLAQQAVRLYRVEFDEAYSDALFGLTKAASRHWLGSGFGAYATAFIVGEIRHGARSRVGVRGGSSHRPLPVVSLDAPQFPAESEPFGASLPDRKPGPAELAVIAELWRTVDELPDVERIAVRGYYQFGLSQDEVAAARGTSQMSVSRALKRARGRLSGPLAA